MSPLTDLNTPSTLNACLFSEKGICLSLRAIHQLSKAQLVVHACTQMHDLASPSDSSYFGSPCGSVQPESVLTPALTLVEICSGLIMWIHVYISALYVSELSERCRRWRENTLVMSFDVGQSTVSECGDRWSGRRSGGRFLCWFVFD